jgi:hypothetical protein
MAYTQVYTTRDLNSMTVDMFGTALNATIQWIDLLVLFAVVGVALSVLMGILFKMSRVLGLG